MTSLLAEGFQEDPLTRWMCPDGRERARLLPGFFSVFVDMAFAYEGVLTTEDGHAVLLFLPPGAWEDTEERRSHYQRRFQDALGGCVDALNIIARMQAERHPVGRPHYYGMFGTVRGSRRGDGRMSALVGEMTSRADREGRPVYTEASSPGGAATCLRTGFSRFGDDLVLPEDGPTLSPMWRNPR